MKKKSVRAIPGSSDNHDRRDPQFTAALAGREHHPKLAPSCAGQRSFDAVMVSTLHNIPVPPGLRESILANRNALELSPRKGWRVGLAVAASIALSAVAIGIWVKQRARDFADYREEIIESSWNNSAHVDLAASDLKYIRNWLSQQKAEANFSLPAGLTDMPVRGCRVFDWHGRKVSFICFVDGLKHLHLFVTDGQKLPDGPVPDSPTFEQCGGWKTASWSQGGKTYVLTGMSYVSFVKRFRKSGQWNLTG